jgi:hypothetical protein
LRNWLFNLPGRILYEQSPCCHFLLHLSRLFRLGRLLYRWQHQSRKLWISPSISGYTTTDLSLFILPYDAI